MPTIKQHVGAFASPNDRAAVERIEQAVDAAWRTHGLVDGDIARLIAASVHRGLASELAAFASSGRVPTGRDYQVMRLELDIATRDEPRVAKWTDALKQFLTCYHACQRAHPAGKRISADQKAAAKTSTEDKS